MLDPQYLGHVADELEKQFAELEENILKDIARRIKENKFENTSTAQYQIDRMKAMGSQYDEMQKQIAKTLGISEKEVSSIIRDSAYESVDRDNTIFKTAYQDGLINRFHFEKDSLKDIILAGIDATNGEIRNICKTTAKAASKLFADNLDQAYLSVASGAFGADEAVKSAVTDIGKRGISWVDYKSGAHRRPDTVVRTALRTGVNQTSCRCQDKNFDDMGGNLVEVTSHIGARPDHALWQGQIYWRRKKYKDYKNFEQSTGYGSGEGLGGWNCRHSFYPYFEGLSSKSFDSYYEGENQERYELEQEQRYNERMIREWKRRSSVNYSGGIDNSKEARKVKEWTQRQDDFLKEHPDLKRNYGREKAIPISGLDVDILKNNRFKKGYEAAVRKGDISSFVTHDIYRKEAEDVEKHLLGLKTKDGIIISGYKTHFIDRKIGQYESSNEPIKGMRKGVSLESIKNALMNGDIKEKVSQSGRRSLSYITDDCIVTINPTTKMLIQTTPKNRKG